MKYLIFADIGEKYSTVAITWVSKMVWIESQFNNSEISIVA